MSPEKSKDNSKIWSIAVLCLSEVVGTSLLLLFGCMGGIPGLSGTAPPPLQAALVFGITVATIVQVFGHVSGAHLNPAVTVAAWIYGFINIPTAVAYMLAQFLGATLGFGILLVLTPTEAFYSKGADLNVTHGFCATVPNPVVGVTLALIGEFLATTVLILLCCGIWDQRNEAKQDGVPIKFGLTIAMLALAEGPYSGCSMNPARSFAPAIFTGVWTGHWIYWIGPMAAGILVPYLYQLTFDRNNKRAEADQADIPLNDHNNKRKESIEGLSSTA